MAKKKKEEEPKEAVMPEEQPVEAAAEKAAEAAVAEEVLVLSKAEVDELKAALAAAQAKEQENLESWQRERADFSNFKKRMERDQEAAAVNYKADALKKFLPILDDLTLAIAHRPQEGEAASWADGIELIIRKFNTLLDNSGMTLIEAEPGTVFDPNIHMAVTADESDEFESDQIIEVLQNGYKMGDRIIRPAIVRVAK